MMNSSLQKIRSQRFTELILKKFRKWIFSKKTAVLLSYDLSQPDKRFRKYSKAEYRVFTYEDLPATAAHFANLTTTYKDLLDMGVLATGGFDIASGDLVSISWFSDKDFYDPHYYHHTFPVAEDQVLQFAGEVAEKYRNTSISVTHLQDTWHFWRVEGKKEMICVVEIANIPSMRLHFHLNFQEKGQLLHFYKLLGIRWCKSEAYTDKKFEHFRKKR